jgi:hypothetical protein
VTATVFIDERHDGRRVELAQRDNPHRSAPVLYLLMERLDEADLRSPGPLVHMLEACGGYRLSALTKFPGSRRLPRSNSPGRWSLLHEGLGTSLWHTAVAQVRCEA